MNGEKLKRHDWQLRNLTKVLHMLTYMQCPSVLLALKKKIVLNLIKIYLYWGLILDLQKLLLRQIVFTIIKKMPNN